MSYRHLSPADKIGGYGSRIGNIQPEGKFMNILSKPVVFFLHTDSMPNDKNRSHRNRRSRLYAQARFKKNPLAKTPCHVPEPRVADMIKVSIKTLLSSHNLGLTICRLSAWQTTNWISPSRPGGDAATSALGSSNMSSPCEPMPGYITGLPSPSTTPCHYVVPEARDGMLRTVGVLSHHCFCKWLDPRHIVGPPSSGLRLYIRGQPLARGKTRHDPMKYVS